MQPLLTLIIPTCDRPHLLEKTVSVFADPDLLSKMEIIVSDNFSSEKTKEAVQKFIDAGSIRYLRTSKRLSMPAHWEFAFKHARGKYVMFNGDDDVILSPFFLRKIFSILIEKDPKFLSWRTAVYWHQDWYKAWEAGNLEITREASGFMYFVDPIEAMRHYSSINARFFPDLLRLIFAKNLGEIIIEKCGKLFWPFAPDFTAPCLMLTQLENKKEWIYIDYNLGFLGRSANCNAAGLEKDGGPKESTRIKDFESEFQGEDLYPCHDLKVFSLTNVMFSPFFLAKSLCPLYFEKNNFHFDFDEFGFRVFQEIRGIHMNNPLQHPEDQKKLEQWLKKISPNSWKRILRRAKQQNVMKTSIKISEDKFVEKEKKEIKKAEVVCLDGIYQMKGDHIFLRLQHFGIKDSLSVANNLHLFFDRFSICSWKNIKMDIDKNRLIPIRPFFPENFPLVLEPKEDSVRVFEENSVIRKKGIKGFFQKLKSFK